MTKRLIDEHELSESELAESEATSLINSVNSHITKKILNSDAIDHIFCNRSLFIFYIPKISICETSTREKFRSDNFESIQMIVLDDQNKSRDVTPTRVLYLSQLQYNLISIIKLVKKRMKIFIRLSPQLSQLI